MNNKDKSLWHQGKTPQGSRGYKARKEEEQRTSPIGPQLPVKTRWLSSHTLGCSESEVLCPWDFPGSSTGVGCHFLLQGIFPTQGSNPGLLHYRQTLNRLSHQGSQIRLQSGTVPFQMSVFTPQTKLQTLGKYSTLRSTTAEADLKMQWGHFPGGPGAKTSPSRTAGASWISGREAKIPHASWPKIQNIKQRQYCNKVKTLKMVYLKKNLIKNLKINVL